MVSDNFSWTNPPASSKSKSCFSGHTHTPVPTYWGQTLAICEDSTQGFDFVEPETWYNMVQQENVDLKKWGWRLGFVENAGSDLTLVCDFVEAPPPTFLTLYLQNASPQPDPPNWREDDIYIYIDLFIFDYMIIYVIYIYILYRHSALYKMTFDVINVDAKIQT